MGPMPRIAYTVTARIPGQALAAEYIQWLEGGHVDAVVAGGAESGMIVRLDPAEGESGEGTVEVETRYIFPSREAFDWYVEHVAPRLRAEGTARFGRERGIRFERRTGVVV